MGNVSTKTYTQKLTYGKMSICKLGFVFCAKFGVRVSRIPSRCLILFTMGIEFRLYVLVLLQAACLSR